MTPPPPQVKPSEAPEAVDKVMEMEGESEVEKKIAAGREESRSTGENVEEQKEAGDTSGDDQVEEEEIEADGEKQRRKSDWRSRIPEPLPLMKSKTAKSPRSPQASPRVYKVGIYMLHPPVPLCLLLILCLALL